MPDVPANAAEAPPPPVRRWARLWKALAAILLGVVVLAGLGVYLLDTPIGRRFVAETIRDHVFENGLRIEIGRIEGSLYGTMTLRDVGLRDPEGVFLSSPRVQLDWNPFAYARGHVDITALTAARATLHRVPRFSPVPATDAPLLPDLDIDLGTFRIDRLTVDPAVTGARRLARVAGEAHITDGRARVRIDGRTLDVPVAGRAATRGGDTLALTLDAVPDADRFRLDLVLDAPGDGVIAALAGLRDPLHATLSGSGGWSKWQGRFAADLGGRDLARLDLKGQDGTFTLRGPLGLSGLAAGSAARLLDGPSQLDLTAVLKQRRADMSGRLTNAAFNLDVNGLADFSASRFEDMKINLVLLRPAVLAKNLSASGLRVSAALSGTFTAPLSRYALNARLLTMNAVGVQDLSAQGEARIDGTTFIIPVSARAGRITGLDSVVGGSLSDVRLDGELAVDGGRVLSDNMRIRSQRIDARAILVADIRTGLYTGAIDGRIDNYRVESVGIFRVETDLDIKGVPGGFALVGTVRARSRQLFNATVSEFLGGNAAGSADLRYGPDGVLRFANLRAQSALLRVTGGSGTYVPGGAIAMQATGVSRPYGPVGLVLTGTLENPKAFVKAQSPGFGIGLAGLEARVKRERGGYRLDLAGSTDYGPLRADVSLGGGPQTVLTINSANLSGIDFAGSLRKLPAGPYAGSLRAEGRGLTGVIRLGAQGRWQEALVNLRASGTVFDGPAGVMLGSAKADARIVLYERPHIVADIHLADSRIRGLAVNAGRALIDYRGGQGSAKILLEGSNGAPFRLTANARLAPDLWTVMVTGRVRGIALATAGPARIVPGASSYELLPTRIDLGGGALRLAGRFGEGLALQSRMEKVDLALINSFYPGYGFGGSVTGSLDFSQVSDNAFPRADARLTLHNFTRTTAALVSQPVDVNFVGKLLPDGGEARAVFRKQGSVIGRMVASLRPLPPGAGAWTSRLMGAPLGGGIRYNGPAETLFSFAGQTGQSITGPVGVAADFSCRLDNPCLKGIVRGRSLTYESQKYGTRLTGIDVNGRFDGNRLELDSITATAGNGKVEASGFIGLASGAGFPMDVAIALDNARLASGDALSARATGQVRLTRTSGQAPVLSGTIRLPESRYRIVREGAAEVPRLTGVRFKTTGHQRFTGSEPAIAAIGGLFDDLRFDIAVTAPDKLYVTGMGLESEWTAGFRLQGTLARPVLVGNLELLRGTLGFAGRSFEIGQGEIGFTGGLAYDPTLRISATEDVEDITVTVNIAGRATNPQISFSSVPGLPQDEILSRVLFGNSIANLSAVQGVQLAASLNALRGSGGGLNPLGKLRSATGVDRLRILGADETAGRGTAVAAGQYITNDIYVELITDARGFTATQLEVSITPWLSLLSQAGGSGASNINVRVRKNYR